MGLYLNLFLSDLFRSNEWYESKYSAGGPAQSAAITGVLHLQEKAARGTSQSKKRRRDDSPPSAPVRPQKRSANLGWNMDQSQTPATQIEMSASQKTEDAFNMDGPKDLVRQGAFGSYFQSQRPHQQDQPQRRLHTIAEGDIHRVPGGFLAGSGRFITIGDSYNEAMALGTDGEQDLVGLGSGIGTNRHHSQPLEVLSPDAVTLTPTPESGAGNRFASAHRRTPSGTLGESARYAQTTDALNPERTTRQHHTSSTSRMQQILLDQFPSAGIVQNESDNQQSGPEDGSDGRSSQRNSNKVSHSQVRNGISNAQSGGTHKRKADKGFHSEEDDGDDDDPHPSKRKRAEESEELARPLAKFACPYHQHDPIRYAACQSYRTETIDSMYRHHLCEYHVHQRHIDDAKLKRLKALGQRKRHKTPGERWWSIYLELFMHNDSPDYASPSPFWAPTLSSTNLADLVSATVELVRAEVGSLATLCQQAISERVDFQVERVFTEELQMVDQRWSMVRKETLAYFHDSGYGSLETSQVVDGGAGKGLPDAGSDISVEP